MASTTRPAAAAEGLPEGVGRAARQGDERAVAAWLDEGGSVDAGCAEFGGVTLLLEAAVGGQEAIMRMLLQRGASVNLQTSVGGTVLMGAAIAGHTTIVQTLLDAKADASLQSDSGRTALMAAEEVRQVDTRAALQQQSHRRILPSRGGRQQQRRAVALCPARVHATALIQPRSHGMRIALVRRSKHICCQPLFRLDKVRQGLGLL